MNVSELRMHGFALFHTRLDSSAFVSALTFSKLLFLIFNSEFIIISKRVSPLKIHFAMA